MQSAEGVACSTKSPAPIFRIGAFPFLEMSSQGEIELKFFEKPPTNDLRKVRPNSERGTDADQQHFIHTTDWGECFGTDRATPIRIHNCIRGGLCDRTVVRRCHETGDAASQSGELRVKFIAWVQLGTECEQQCAGGCAVSRLFRHGGGQELLGKRGGIEWRVRGIGSEPAGGQCQRIECSVGRKQSQYGDRRARLRDP